MLKSSVEQPFKTVVLDDAENLLQVIEFISSKNLALFSRIKSDFLETRMRIVK